MLEPWVEKLLRNHNYLLMFLFSLGLSIFVSGIVWFFGGQTVFAVGIISLALSYPVITYFLSVNKGVVTRRYTFNDLLVNHLDEVFASWSIFIGVVLGLYVGAYSELLTEFIYQEAFVEGLDGMITGRVELFNMVLFNNLVVGAVTFILCFISFSALIFVLVWNASIVSYYLYSLEGYAFLIALFLLPHGLLEVAGYVFSGIAGSVLAFRVDNWSGLSTDEKMSVWKDVGLLVFGAALFIFIGAVVETL